MKSTGSEVENEILLAAWLSLIMGYYWNIAPPVLASGVLAIFSEYVAWGNSGLVTCLQLWHRKMSTDNLFCCFQHWHKLIINDVNISMSLFCCCFLTNGKIVEELKEIVVCVVLFVFFTFGAWSCFLFKFCCMERFLFHFIEGWTFLFHWICYYYLTFFLWSSLYKFLTNMNGNSVLEKIYVQICYTWDGVGVLSCFFLLLLPCIFYQRQPKCNFANQHSQQSNTRFFHK